MSSLSYEIENFCNIKGYKIFYRIIGSGSSERAILFLHGKGSHCGYLQNIVSDSLLKRADFYALDLPGFGNSSGRRGHIDSFDIYIDLIDRFINNKIERAGVRELYLVCEGMGALLGFYYSKTRPSVPVKGLIFLPGTFYVKELRNPFVRAALKIVNTFAPEFNIRERSSIRAYTNNSVFWDILESDLLWEREASVRLLCEMERYLTFMRSEIVKATVPILIFHGKDDLYTGVGECIAIFAGVSYSERNRIVILENSNHWLIIDSDLARVRSVLLDWIE